jgi:uncharacterized protein YndB with AHSA1/START domain
MTQTSAISCDQFIAHTPEEVWRALTDPDLLARWWAPGDIRPVAGRFSLDMGAWGHQPCEVTAVVATLWVPRTPSAQLRRPSGTRG